MTRPVDAITLPFGSATGLVTFPHDHNEIKEQNFPHCGDRPPRFFPSLSDTPDCETLGKVYFQSIRLAIALVCLGASLILASHWLGLLPDASRINNDSRRRISEAVAINSASHVRKQQWVELRIIAQTLVDRDDSLLSIGVRSKHGRLKVEAGPHEEFLLQARIKGHGIQKVAVPITLNRRHWGEVELCFLAPEQSLSGAVLDHPLTRLLAFFCIAGLFFYTIFVGKLIGVFRSTQVVPERVRQALDTLAEGLLVLDERAAIVLANKSFADTVDIPVDQLVKTTADALPWTGEGQTRCQSYPWIKAIKENQTQTEEILYLNIPGHKRRIFSVNAAPIGGHGSPRGALATFRDVTLIEEHRAELESTLNLLRDSRDEIEEKNRELEILATQDALTGCLNRRAFFERFGRFWQQSHRDGEPLSCVMFDNDHFKSVNDTYGHGVGDEVLRQVAAVLRAHHADHGLVCRYGGEEFCVLMPGVAFEAAIELAEEARKSIEAIRLEDPAELRLTASVGVSETRFGAADPQELINQADICLYTAKRNGRNRVIPYSAGMTQVDDTPKEETRRNTEVPFPAVSALLAALEFRDGVTAQHSRRVADLCCRIASQYMDSQSQYLLEIAALLHDLGKVGVPEEILLKQGKLSPDEIETIAFHDRLGSELVENAFRCDELTQILRYRNAYYDGSGRNRVPAAGDDLPLGARMLSICDSYDSMVSDRVYRNGCSHQVAIEELRRLAGTQFDPELVEHFIQTVTEKPVTTKSDSEQESALQIGFQVERLAEAIANQDREDTTLLALRLGLYAHQCEAELVASVAERIGQHAIGDEVPWMELLHDTQDLLKICNANQKNILQRKQEKVESGDQVNLAE